MNYDVEKARRDIGQDIKVKVQGKFRRGKIATVGVAKSTRELMVKVTVYYNEMPWSATFPQTQWYKLTAIRKADKERWLS